MEGLRELIGLPPGLFVALGEITARYGQIEYLLAMTIHRTATLSYDESINYLELIKYNDKTKIEAEDAFRRYAIRTFGETEGLERSRKFTTLLNAWIKNNGLADRRHDVIHCCWSIKSGRVTGTRKGKLLEVDRHPAELKDIEELANELKNFVILLNDATMPTTLTGPKEAIDAMRNPNFLLKDTISGIETRSTCAETPTFTMSEYLPKLSGD